jgi:putative transposase
MSKLIRLLTTDNSFFVTIVTHERQPILFESAPMLRAAIDSAMAKFGANERAWVILPDHYHGIIQTGSISISTVVQCFKMSFASRYRLAVGMRSGRVWQSRFWDHVIRDQRDLHFHLDYIHYNPVKHGRVSDPAEYPLSSYRDYLQAGNYPRDWGRSDSPMIERDFGE